MPCTGSSLIPRWAGNPFTLGRGHRALPQAAVPLPHWHCAASSPDHAAGPPSPQLFLSPPNCVSHCSILSGAVGAPGTQCPALGGPALPRCPLTLPGHGEPCPGRLEKVGWGAGGGPGTLGGTVGHRATGSGCEQWPNAALHCGGCGQSCLPGEEEGPGGGCRCRAAGFGEGAGSWLAHPPTSNFHEQLCPAAGGEIGCRGYGGTHGPVPGQRQSPGERRGGPWAPSEHPQH